MLNAALCALVLAGCGRIGFATERGDAEIAADAAADAACAFGPWTTPVPVPELSSTVGDFGGQVTADGLGYYFQSGRSGSQQLYASHRSARGAAWSTPVMIAELDTQAEQIEAAPVSGELEIYINSTRPTGASQCTWHAERASTAVPFGTPVRLDALCPAGREAVGPYASLDNLTLYYSTMEASPFGTIYETHRASTADAFGAGDPVAGLATGAKGYPYVTPDALALYYEALGTGAGHHLYVTARADPGGAFPAAVPIPNVDDDSDNEDVSLTADGREIFFASSRTGTMGDKDIFTATRACE